MNLKLDNTKDYTVIAINFMAMTVRTEILKPIQFKDTDNYSWKPKGKRKYTSMNIAPDMLIFEGVENLPFAVDTDGNGSGVWRGNARFNFVTDKPAELAEWLTKHNLNKEFTAWSKMVYVPTTNDVDDEEKQLYPA